MIEQRGIRPRVLVNTTVSVDIACKHEEASTQRGVQHCIQTARTTGYAIGHSIDIQVACACADVRCSQTHRCLQTGKGGRLFTNASLSTNRGGPSYTMFPKMIPVSVDDTCHFFFSLLLFFYERKKKIRTKSKCVSQHQSRHRQRLQTKKGKQGKNTMSTASPS